MNVAELTEIAANKALKSQKPRAIEPGRYTTIIEPRPAARLLSTMMGAFNAGAAAAGSAAAAAAAVAAGSTSAASAGRSSTPTARRRSGQKLFSDSFTLKSDIGNPVLRQTPIMNDGSPAKPVTWVEKGVLKNLYYDPATARRQKVAPSTPTRT